MGSLWTSNPKQARSAFVPIASTVFVPSLVVWNRARVSTFSHTRCRAETRRADGPVVGAATLTDDLEVPRECRPPGPGFTLRPRAARR